MEKDDKKSPKEASEMFHKVMKVLSTSKVRKPTKEEDKKAKKDDRKHK